MKVSDTYFNEWQLYSEIFSQQNLYSAFMVIKLKSSLSHTGYLK